MFFSFLCFTLSANLSAAGPEGLQASILKTKLNSLAWSSHKEAPELTPSLLEESLGKAQGFLLASQKPDGFFNYEYDWISQSLTNEDNPVRQAGMH